MAHQIKGVFLILFQSYNIFMPVIHGIATIIPQAILLDNLVKFLVFNFLHLVHILVLILFDLDFGVILVKYLFQSQASQRMQLKHPLLRQCDLSGRQGTIWKFLWLFFFGLIFTFYWTWSIWFFFLLFLLIFIYLFSVIAAFLKVFLLFNNMQERLIRLHHRHVINFIMNLQNIHHRALTPIRQLHNLRRN